MKLNKRAVIILQWDADENRLLSKEIQRKKKECGPLTMKERNNFCFGSKPVNQTIVDIPEEVLNEMRQLNPRDIVNITVNP